MIYTAEAIRLTELAYGDQGCTRHPGWPAHLSNECDRLAGVKPFTDDTRCSVCDRRWDRRLPREHEGCAAVMADGTREYAYPITTVSRKGQEVRIDRDDLGID